MNSSNSLYPLCTEIMNMSKVTDVIDHSTHIPNPIDCNGNNINDAILNSSNISDIVDHSSDNPDPEDCNVNNTDNDTDNNSISNLPSVTKVPCTLHIPNFRMKYNDWNQYPPVKYCREMKGYNWITTELYNETTVASLLPTDISCSGHNKRDPLECAKAAEKLFPLGRIFSSPEQIDQVLIKFSHKWGFKKNHPGNFFGCYYGTSIHTKGRGRENDLSGKLVKRIKTQSLKCGCEFKKTYRSIDMYNVQHDGVRVPKIYFKAVITKANYIHICELSTQSHRKAIISSGGLIFNLEGLTVPIYLLSTNPRLSTKILRPYLEKYLPFYKSCDTSCIRNFRKRVLAYNIAHGDAKVPTYNDIEKFVSSNKIAANEHMVEDCTVSQNNLSELSKKFMQDGDSHWSTIKFFEDLIAKGTNIKYHVRYHPKSRRPVAICWSLIEMRSDLRRYGDVLFLDAQKTDINKPGWVYIGPCVKNNEN